jgi:hypothetical protein
VVREAPREVRRGSLGARASGPLFWRTLAGLFLGGGGAAGLEGCLPRGHFPREGRHAGRRPAHPGVAITSEEARVGWPDGSGELIAKSPMPPPTIAEKNQMEKGHWNWREIRLPASSAFGEDNVRSRRWPNLLTFSRSRTAWRRAAGGRFNIPCGTPRAGRRRPVILGVGGSSLSEIRGEMGQLPVRRAKASSACRKAAREDNQHLPHSESANGVPPEFDKIFRS